MKQCFRLMRRQSNVPLARATWYDAELAESKPRECFYPRVAFLDAINLPG